MDIVQALILGLVQGLTEFLPVSSSAHLIGIRWLMGWEDPGLSFDVALHLGSLVAVLLYFARDWLRLIRSTVAQVLSRGRDTNGEGRLAPYILVATIPAAVAGALGESRLEELFHGDSPAAQATGIFIIGILMIVMAGLLGLAERLASHTRDMNQLSLGQALVIGAAQALAIVPGVSRSGSTITAGLFMNLKREAAARFSFLLGTPIILGAGLKQVYDILESGGLQSADAAAFVAGFVAAAVSGFAAIFWLLKFLQKHNTVPFIAYRVVAGLFLIVLVLSGVRG